MDLESLTRLTPEPNDNSSPFTVTPEPSASSPTEDQDDHHLLPVTPDGVETTPPITEELEISPISDPLGAGSVNPVVRVAFQQDEQSQETPGESPVVSGASSQNSPFEAVSEDLDSTPPAATEEDNFVLV